MKHLILIIQLCFISLFVSTYSWSQESSRSDYVEQLSGPRIGVTYVRGEAAEKLREDFDAVPIVSQFGWQLEWRFFSMEDGPDGVVELVPLVGGVEQNLFLPSLNFLIGLRSPKGTEAGIGPNLSPTGASIVLAVGFTTQAGKLNIPINLAIVPSPKGARFSLLIGFNK